ncbi:MAG: zinc finger Ran-binding domain-containing protein [Oscillospiraceae bacterium]|nr:zinc finger Ran-binding domain-containing protein [Oscillospiraceae bacterium]
MHTNIGGKIKVLAKVITWLGIIISVIMGLNLNTAAPISSSGSSFISVAIIVVGSLASWIGSFLLYGFGELIEKTTEVARYTAMQQQLSQARQPLPIAQLLPRPVPVSQPVTKPVSNGEGLWECSCGTMNPPHFTNCRACSKLKKA